MDKPELDGQIEELIEKSALLIEQSLPVIEERCSNIMNSIIKWLDSKLS